MFKISLIPCVIVAVVWVTAKLVDIKSVQNIQRAFNVADALPSNYVKDGSVDYTKYVQAAVDKYNIITFPNFPIMVSGIRVKSNRRLTFLKGARLIMKPVATGSYNVLQLRNASNIVIENPVIIGERKKHKGKDGQWGMGVGIYSSNNIVIKNAVIEDCWGDAIYIGKSSDTLLPCKDITISNAVLKNNRRNGISVISVDGLNLISPYIGYTQGQAPMAGIDFEPNDEIDQLKNIRVSNIRTEFNKGGGIMFFLNNLYGKNDNKIDIRITGHSDIGSLYGARIINENKKSSDFKVLGQIIFENVNWKQNTDRALNAFRFEESDVQLSLDKVQVIDNKNRTLTTDKVDSLLKKSVNKVSRQHITVLN